MKQALPWRGALTPFVHQRAEVEQHGRAESRALFWEMGCSRGDTEYLAPDGWHRLDAYDGGVVAQVRMPGAVASFVSPVRYVVEDCSEFIHIKSGRGVDQVLTPNHRMPWFSGPGGRLNVSTAADVENRALSQVAARRYLPVRFTLDPLGKGTGLTPDQLRLQIAVMADGHFSRRCKTTRCQMQLHKPRKIGRLRFLLLRAGIDAYERPVRGRPQAVAFSFDAPLRMKRYPWWHLTATERDIILDEVWRWDGSACREGKGEGWRFFSKHEEDADFIQYVAAAAGLVPAKSQLTSDGNWWVTVRGRPLDSLTVTAKNFSRVPSTDGKAYCFQVPDGFLVLRHNGRVFITGNCGKSAPCVAEAAALFEAGEIEQLLVLAPNNVHRNWVTDEIPAHMPAEILEKTCLLGWTSSYQTKRFQRQMDELIRHEDGLRIFCMSYSGIMTKVGGRFTRRFLDRGRTLYVADESHLIKSPGSKRTKRVLASSKYAIMRRILSGTPITNSPFDIYSQLKFLDPEVWHEIGCQTFAAFKTHFGIFEQRMVLDKKKGKLREYPELITYRNLNQLNQMVDTYGSRLLKEDVLDLPPKLYSTRYFELEPSVRRVYDEIREEFMAFLESGEIVTAPLAIVRMIRLQQVTSGYIPADGDGPDNVTMLSPAANTRRIQALLEILEEHRGHHTLVWAKYTNDIRMIAQAVKQAGFSCRTYYGATSEKDRDKNKADFQAGEYDVLVGNPAAAGLGLTLHRATLCVFFNSTYRLDERKQAEDRAHRIGQERPVLIVDLVAKDTIDELIVRALRRKQKLSDIILGDPAREWI